MVDQGSNACNNFIVQNMFPVIPHNDAGSYDWTVSYELKKSIFVSSSSLNGARLFPWEIPDRCAPTATNYPSKYAETANARLYISCTPFVSHVRVGICDNRWIKLMFKDHGMWSNVKFYETFTKQVVVKWNECQSYSLMSNSYLFG